MPNYLKTDTKKKVFYQVKRLTLHPKMHHFTRQSAPFHAIKYGRLRDDLHQSILPLVINIITLTIGSPRNSVRVVFLIARGWRGTSLPRVNVCKEIQRHRCWAFSMKVCLKRCNLLRINQKKRNTYGVVPHKPCINPGEPALSFGNPGLSKAQHLRRWNVYFII